MARPRAIRPYFDTASPGPGRLILRLSHTIENGGFALGYRSTAMMRFSFVIAAAIVLSLGGIAGYLIQLF
jgi:hypothetical protein